VLVAQAENGAGLGQQERLVERLSVSNHRWTGRDARKHNENNYSQDNFVLARNALDYAQLIQF
jgi:hypothetical protein